MILSKKGFDTYTILIPDRLKPPADVEQAVFGPETRIILGQAKFPEQIADETWQACDALLAWHDLHYTIDLLKKLDRCQVIVRVGIGFDNVDLKAAADLKIPVCTVPDYGVDDVADHAMAMLLALSRGLSVCNNLVRRRIWDWEYASGLKRLTQTTIGIIGFGRIGAAVAHRARNFGIQTLFYDPYQPIGIEKSWGFERCFELNEIATRSDFISIHTPLTNETENMIDAGFFESCQKQPILINTARGGIVNHDALYDALKSNLIRAVGLDVLSEEPPNQKMRLIQAWQDAEDWIVNRLIVTPHCAFCNQEALIEMRRKAALEALRILKGETPRSCVNKAFM